MKALGGGVAGVLAPVRQAIPVGVRGFAETNQPDLFGDAGGHGEHWHVHHAATHVFATGDDVTAGWGLTGTEKTRTVDVAPAPNPDLLTLHAWVHPDRTAKPG